MTAEELPDEEVPATAEVLGQALRDRMAEAGERFMNSLTVMSDGRDPYRRDTPANHAAGAFVRDLLAASGRASLHPRGLHYVAVMGKFTRPDGSRYLNNRTDYGWLKDATTAARWLGYVDWDQIADERSGDPVRRLLPDPESPEPYEPEVTEASVSVEVEGSVTSEAPGIDLDGIAEPVQPYRIVIWSEKSSTEDTLRALMYLADAVYVGAGDAADATIAKIAADARTDGRPLAVITLADCDPDGYAMPAAIARKLQAHHDLDPLPRVRVRHAGLTPAQVREHNLPANRLDAETDAVRRWRERTGTEQTELDTLASDVTRERILRRMVRDALRALRVPNLLADFRAYRDEWQAEADEVLAAATDGEEWQAITEEADELRREVDERIAELREEAEERAQELHDRAQDLVGEVDLPEFDPPEVVEPDDDDTDVYDSERGWVEATRRLIARRDYLDLDEAPATEDDS